MKSKYDWLILVEILLIALTPAIFWIALSNPALVFTKIVIAIVWVVQIALLFYTLKASDRDLERFARIISNDDDYHMLAREGWLRPHNEVLNEINNVITSFKDLKSRKESDLLFFKLVMEHTPVGIMAITGEGKVVLINRAAKELLGIEDIIEIDHLDRRRDGLASWFCQLSYHNPAVLSLDSPSRSLYLSVVAAGMKLRDMEIKLFSLKDIRHEVDRREMETLQRIMRLLSHEVVNSISPISLLAESIRNNLKEIFSGMGDERLKTSGLQDIELGLSTIHKRSRDLNDFVASIRVLTTIPEPKLECNGVDSLLQQSAGLMSAQLKERGISLFTETANAKVVCDSKLIIQVLINLVKNSMEALEGVQDACIKIWAEKNEETTNIMVEDNGPGIPGNMKEDIFSPFFTTKVSGSGIGLSFSRQVMILHRGEINLRSDEGKTIFTLTFPLADCV